LIDELSRHRLFTKLEDILGAQDAAVLIEYLPPVGWGEVATKQDLEQLSTRLDSLASEVQDLRSEVGAEFRDVRTEMAAEFRDLRSEFVSLRSEISYQFRTTVFAMMGMMVTLTGLVFAATKLG